MQTHFICIRKSYRNRKMKKTVRQQKVRQQKSYAINASECRWRPLCTSRTAHIF